VRPARDALGLGLPTRLKPPTISETYESPPTASRRRSLLVATDSLLRCAKRYTSGPAQLCIVIAMANCAYCGRHATVIIPSNPGDVCLTHAQEFWTGFLSYVSDQCRQLRAIAVVAAGPSPQDAQSASVSPSLPPRFINRDSPNTVRASLQAPDQASA
jgi:hypothetical protein